MMDDNDHDIKQPFRANKKVDPASMNEKTCCTKDCLKTFTIFFILIILLSGVALLVAGIYMFTIRDQAIAILSGTIFYMSNFLIIIAGAVIFITAILGLGGACINSKTHVDIKRKIIILFIVLLVFILLLELAGGGIAFFKWGTIMVSLRSQLNTTMIRNYGISNTAPPKILKLMKATDVTQQKYRCCGVTTFHDWKMSPYIKHENVSKGSDANKTPESCCKTKSERCSQSDHPSNINTVGCLNHFVKFLSTNLIVIGSIAFGIAGIQLLGIIISICFLQSLDRKGYIGENYRESKRQTYT